jgi:hypothetical protein
MYFQRGPLTAENETTRHRTHRTHRCGATKWARTNHHVVLMCSRTNTSAGIYSVPRILKHAHMNVNTYIHVKYHPLDIWHSLWFCAHDEASCACTFLQGDADLCVCTRLAVHSQRRFRRSSPCASTLLRPPREPPTSSLLWGSRPSRSWQCLRGEEIKSEISL